MKRFEKIIAAALVCILMVTAATGCSGGILSYDWSTEIAQITAYREDLYYGANAPITIADSSFSSAAATASWTIKGNPKRYLEGYELYMKGNIVSPKAVDYQTLLITGPSVNGNGALYRILLYDGDLSVSEVCSKMYSEFNATISSGAYANKSYKDCVQNAIDARVMMEVYHLENTSEDESVWAVIELVYGLSEEPSLC